MQSWGRSGWVGQLQIRAKGILDSEGQPQKQRQESHLSLGLTLWPSSFYRVFLVTSVPPAPLEPE